MQDPGYKMQAGQRSKADSAKSMADKLVNARCQRFVNPVNPQILFL
jgi:hypothetical protein